MKMFRLELEELNFFEKQIEESEKVQKQFVNVEMLPDELLKSDPTTEEEYDEG